MLPSTVSTRSTAAGLEIGFKSTPDATAVYNERLQTAGTVDRVVVRSDS